MDEIICISIMAVWLLVFLWAIGPAKMDDWLLGGKSIQKAPRK